MIGRLKGTIAAVGEGQALIDVQGVGYLVHAGSRTLGKLTVGEAAELFVETVWNLGEVVVPFRPNPAARPSPSQNSPKWPKGCSGISAPARW